MLFEFPAAEKRTAFADSVRALYPGGEYIVDHIDDGPWYVLVVRSAEDPNWLLEKALRAYPKATMPRLESWDDGGELEKREVYIVPKFVSSLAYYWTGEHEFETDDIAMEAFATCPAAGELDGVLIELLCPKDADAALADHAAGIEPPHPAASWEFREALTDLVARVGAGQVAKRVLDIISNLGVEEDMVELVLGWHAAVAVPVGD